jgi:hypothetical protein
VEKIEYIVEDETSSSVPPAAPPFHPAPWKEAFISNQIDQAAECFDHVQFDIPFTEHTTSYW